MIVVPNRVARNDINTATVPGITALAWLPATHQLLGSDGAAKTFFTIDPATGITTLIKTAHLAEAFRMNYEVHHGGNSLNNVANLHVIMAIRNTEFFEVLLPDAMQKYGLAEDITVDRDGLVHAPTEPGLGANIDFELIERKELGVLS